MLHASPLQASAPEVPISKPVLQWRDAFRKVLYQGRVVRALQSERIHCMSPAEYAVEFDRTVEQIGVCPFTDEMKAKMLMHLFMSHVMNPPLRGIAYSAPGDLSRDEFRPPEFSYALHERGIAKPSTYKEMSAMHRPKLDMVTPGQAQRFFEFIAQIDFFSWKKPNLLCAMRMSLAADFAYMSGVNPERIALGLLFPKKFNGSLECDTSEWVFHATLILLGEKGTLYAIDPTVCTKAVDIQEWVSSLTKHEPKMCGKVDSISKGVSIQLKRDVTNIVYLPYKSTFVYSPIEHRITANMSSEEDHREDQAQLSFAQVEKHFKDGGIESLPRSLQELV